MKHGSADASVFVRQIDEALGQTGITGIAVCLLGGWLSGNPDSSHPSDQQRVKSCWIICAAAALIKQQLTD